ncbi:MAG: mannonate dehydratase [Saccharofermentanales bacterium]
MKMIFRWYGYDDPVTLEKIRQIPGMTGIVSAVYDVPPGSLWPEKTISDLVSRARACGLEFEAVESVPVHEDIKSGGGRAQEYIDNYCENVRRLGKAGIRVICYNFMPVFDWLRSDLASVLPDGSSALSYDNEAVLSMDPAQNDLSLPGWDASYTKSELRDLLGRYKNISEEILWKNLENFLKQVIPVAQEFDVKMAIHPDDPPWSIFGLPRIITNSENIRRLLGLVDSPANGLTFCTGSLGADKRNDLPEMIREFGKRIHFAHIRNIRITGDRSFEESAHLSSSGSLDIYEIVKALHDSGFDGYIRPDHGRMIWGETGRAGYGLYDRALGAVYIQGLWEAIDKSSKSGNQSD